MRVVRVQPKLNMALPKAGKFVHVTILLAIIATVTLLLHHGGMTMTSSGSTGSATVLAEGDRFKIFVPFPSPASFMVQVGEPEHLIDQLRRRINWLDTITTGGNADVSSLERARSAYLESMKSFVSGTVFNDAELSVKPGLRTEKSVIQGKLDMATRTVGRDWTYLGDTMTGWARLNNVRDLLKDVFENNIGGDYIETGVWRGGSSMFARAVIRAYGEGSTRKSYVCDSFAGLPPNSRGVHPGDSGWDGTAYLEVNEEIVQEGFEKYSLLDPNVVFAKGFFNETMPPLSDMIDTLAVMRLDGDMYESTVDVLYNLYDKLSIGGYVIMDDWNGFPSKAACEDFFAVHGFEPTIIEIDGTAAYWKKTEEIEIQYWRYEKNQFKQVS